MFVPIALFIGLSSSRAPPHSSNQPAEENQDIESTAGVEDPTSLPPYTPNQPPPYEQTAPLESVTSTNTSEYEEVTVTSPAGNVDSELWIRLLISAADESKIFCCPQQDFYGMLMLTGIMTLFLTIALICIKTTEKDPDVSHNRYKRPS